MKERWRVLPNLLKRITQDGNDNIAHVLKAHLFTEFLMEKVLIKTYGKKADPIIFLELRYIQKLEIISALGTWPPYVVASLRQLNKIRNRYGHQLDFEVPKSEFKKLFNGMESDLAYPAWNDSDIRMAIKHYLMCISGHMFPK